MILSFADKKTAALFNDDVCAAEWRQVKKVALRKLDYLDSATRLDDLKSPPHNKLEKLTKDRKGQHSIRINDRWRVCFVWKPEGPEDVEITDYH